MNIVVMVYASGRDGVINMQKCTHEVFEGRVKLAPGDRSRVATNKMGRLTDAVACEVKAMVEAVAETMTYLEVAMKEKITISVEIRVVDDDAIILGRSARYDGIPRDDPMGTSSEIYKLVPLAKEVARTMLWQMAVTR